jgi:raffinose/stachyose/melibiose transport system substrate-binding protein
MIFLISGCKKIEKPVTIQFFHYKQNYINEINQIVSAFHKKNPNIFIEIESLPFDIKNVLKSRFESGDAPDLIMLSSVQMVKDYTELGYLLDLSKERCTGRLLSSVRSEVSLNNKIFSYPVNMKAMGIFYNRDLFEKENMEIPDTISKMKKVHEIVKKKKIKLLSVAGKENSNFAYMFSMAHGISLNLSDIEFKDWIGKMNQNKDSFNNNKISDILKVMDYYKSNYDMIDNEYDSNKQVQDFNDNKVAMFFGDISLSNKCKINVGLISFPLTDKPEDDAVFCEPEANLVISSKSMPEKIDAAKKLMDFFSSDAVVKMFESNCKFIPSVRNADTSILGVPEQNLYKFIQDNKIMPYYFNYYPQQVFEKTKNDMKDFLEKKKNYQSLIKSLDEEWKKNMKASEKK